MLRAHRLLPAVAAAFLLATTTACASGGYYGQSRYPYGSNARNLDARAYRIGFEEGLRRGADDARRGRRFDYARQREYRSATRGYDGYGNRNAYRNVFRDGFVAGYNDGYRRNGRDGGYRDRDGYRRY